MGLPEHRRTLPHFDISEQGLRELEIWLRDRLGLGGGGDGWRFDIQNTGGFGYVRFNDAFDLDTFPIPDSPLANGGNWGGVFEDDSGQGLLLGSTTLLYLLSLLDMTIQANGELVITADDTITVNIRVAGKTYVLNDHLLNPLVTYTG